MPLKQSLLLTSKLSKQFNGFTYLMQKFSTSAQWLSFVSIQDPNALKKATSSVISLPDLYAQFLELLCYICVEESGLYNMMIDL